MPISTWLIVGGAWVLLIVLTIALRNHGAEPHDAGPGGPGTRDDG